MLRDAEGGKPPTALAIFEIFLRKKKSILDTSPVKFSSKLETCSLLACLHDQNKSGFFEGPPSNLPIRPIEKVFKNIWLAEKKLALQKSHLYFDHVNRLYEFLAVQGNVSIGSRALEPPGYALEYTV